MDAKDLAAVLVDGIGEDKGENGHELNEDVEGGAGGVLERVSHGVADDSSLVLGAGNLIAVFLEALLAGLVGALDELLHLTALNVLLGVIPSASGVRGGNGHLHTADETTDEKARQGELAEAEADQEGGEDDEGSRGNHLSQGALGGNGDASSVVGRGDAALRVS